MPDHIAYLLLFAADSTLLAIGADCLIVIDSQRAEVLAGAPVPDDAAIAIQILEAVAGEVVSRSLRHAARASWADAVVEPSSLLWLFWAAGYALPSFTHITEVSQ